jgi:hypothetical protein
MVGMHTYREFAEEGRRRMRDASTVDPSVKASIEKYGVGLTNFYKSFGMKNLEKPAGVEYKMKLPHHLSGSEGESEGEESLGESVSGSESEESIGTSTAASFLGRTRGYESGVERHLAEQLGTKKAARYIEKAKARREAAAERVANETRAAAKKAGERRRRHSSKTDRGTESSASSTPLTFPTASKASKAVAQALTGGGGGGGGSGSSSSGKKRGRPYKVTGRIVTIENPFTGSRQSIQNKQ